MLDDVRERLAGDEVGGRLHWRRLRSGHTRSSTGTGARRARPASAAASPSSVRIAGWIPRASARNSSSAPRTSVSASDNNSSTACWSPACPCASCNARRIPSSRCCAPSCRSPSTRRHSASPASTMRAREARASASCARSSACSREFSQRQARRRADRLNQLSVIQQRRIVHEHREPLAGRLQHRRRTPRPRSRVKRATVSIDIAPLAGGQKPSSSEQSPTRARSRHGLAPAATNPTPPPDQPPRTLQPRPQQTNQERHRDRRKTTSRPTTEPCPPSSAQRVHHQQRTETRCRCGRREQHRSHGLAGRDARRTWRTITQPQEAGS